MPDSKYLFELITREDGRKTKAFIASPNDVIYTLERLKEDDGVKPDDLYVNFLVDIGAANEVKPDESIGMSDLVMRVPLFSGKAFVRIFKQPEAYARYVADREREQEKENDAS